MMLQKPLRTAFYTLLFASLFTGCNDKPSNAVSEVHWDRDMCARCVMVVSDRHNTVQVKNPQNAKVYMFDDIGCMALWFKEADIEWQDKAVVWITDVISGEWIDARKAFYDTENITPMAYGFSAHKTKESIKATEEIITYDEVLKRVVAVGK
ncbi:MAG: hypothetical protein PHU40_02210 [Sulfurimonas sp.]|nr:hypothetical protein [Sulfurimonas sp.]